MLAPYGATSAITNPSLGWDADPAWSPDGRRIAFARAGENGADLYVLELATGRVDRLTESPAVVEAHPDWSPDGRRIAFSRRSGRGNAYEIALVPAVGGRPQKPRRR
jgi:Tol biopolymer transport system component